MKKLLASVLLATIVLVALAAIPCTIAAEEISVTDAASHVGQRATVCGQWPVPPSQLDCSHDCYGRSLSRGNPRLE